MKNKSVKQLDTTCDLETELKYNVIVTALLAYILSRYPEFFGL